MLKKSTLLAWQRLGMTALALGLQAMSGQALSAESGLKRRVTLSAEVDEDLPAKSFFRSFFSFLVLSLFLPFFLSLPFFHSSVIFSFPFHPASLSKTHCRLLTG